MKKALSLIVVLSLIVAAAAPAAAEGFITWADFSSAYNQMKKPEGAGLLDLSLFFASNYQVDSRVAYRMYPLVDRDTVRIEALFSEPLLSMTDQNAVPVGISVATTSLEDLPAFMIVASRVLAALDQATDTEPYQAMLFKYFEGYLSRKQQLFQLPSPGCYLYLSFMYDSFSIAYMNDLAKTQP